MNIDVEVAADRVVDLIFGKVQVKARDVADRERAELLQKMKDERITPY
jgi:hypothetical protein